MLKIAKCFEFEASHQLPDEDCYGKCKFLHGHTYKLIVEVQGTVDDKGWIMNFRDLKEIVNRSVLKRYDHAHLNDYFEISTAENIALKIFEDLSIALNNGSTRLFAVELWETSNSYARVEI
jgi:6-pyruvoyltetrahydropterin/6-carboxytetrahydropterin synthase